MNPRLYHRFQSIVYEHAGIHLNANKEALVTARLGKRLRALGIANLRDYLAYLEEDSQGEELVHFLDALATNYTSFFREREHFALLAEQVAAWFQAGQRSFTIWSAASSTGEEPYSLSMLMSELVGPASYRILATDISTRALAYAKAGSYTLKAISALSKADRLKYFTRVAAKKGDLWQLNPEIRRPVTFARLNLAAPPFPMHGPFDAIFCRNVMIYFDDRVRAALIAQIEKLLRPGGILAVGHAEALSGMRCGLRMIRPSVYVK